MVGPAGYNTTSGATMISSFTGSGNVLSHGCRNRLAARHSLITTTATMTVSLGGSGSGRHRRSTWPGHSEMELALHPTGFNVSNLQGGVTSVTVEFNFSNAAGGGLC